MTPSPSPGPPQWPHCNCARSCAARGQVQGSASGSPHPRDRSLPLEPCCPAVSGAEVSAAFPTIRAPSPGLPGPLTFWYSGHCSHVRVPVGHNQRHRPWHNERVGGTARPPTHAWCMMAGLGAGILLTTPPSSATACYALPDSERQQKQISKLPNRGTSQQRDFPTLCFPRISHTNVLNRTSIAPVPAV